MSAEPSELFRRIAPEPSGPPPVDAIVRRARRRRRLEALTAGLVVAALVAAVVLVVDRAEESRRPAAPAPRVTRAALLARPLDLPTMGSAGCRKTKQSEQTGPIFIGTHPYFDDPRANGMTWYRRGWQLSKTPLWSDTGYEGPLLLRGGRIDKTGPMRFDMPEFVGDHMPTRLYFSAAERRYEPPADEWLTHFNVAVRSAGCYAYQVDGDGFSYHVVFEARLH